MKVSKTNKCSKCNGEGEYYFRLPDDVGSPNLVTCEECNGTGKVSKLTPEDRKELEEKE